MKFSRYSFLCLMATLLFSACNGDRSPDQSALEEGDELETVSRAPISQLEAEETRSHLLDKAKKVVIAIDGRDMAALSEYVHPVEGVRFSPYAYIDVNEHLVFTAEQTAQLMKVDTVYTWGKQDGSGEPIVMTPAEFFDHYLYNKDYMNPDQIGYDRVIGQGNTTSNYRDLYKEGHLVEYYIAGKDPQYDGMDWGSLIMVFTPYQGEWYLQSISHGQWTI